MGTLINIIKLQDDNLSIKMETILALNKMGNETTDDKIEVLYVLSRIGKTECINPILKIATEPPLKTYAFTV